MLSVATINLYGRSARWSQRRWLLVEQLIEAAPDLISLQEIHFASGQGRWLRKQLNARLTAVDPNAQPYQLLQKRANLPSHSYFEGIGILSRLPVVYHDAISLGYGRVALRANVELPSRQTLDFVAVHLHNNARDIEARKEQAMALTGWLNTHRRAVLQIVAGDFNEVPDGLAVQWMKQGFRSAYEAANGRDPLATWPTALVEGEKALCLDYIFLSTAVGRIQSAAIICRQPAPNDNTLYPSDHVGLLARLDVQ